MKRYSYQRHARSAIIYGLLTILAIIIILLFLNYPSDLFGALYLAAFSLFLGCVIVIPPLIVSPTRLEIDDAGIRYRSLRKCVDVPWPRLQQVKETGSRRSTVYTMDGKFVITTWFEPADAPQSPLKKLLTDDTNTYYREILDEIQKRAPQAEWRTEPIYGLIRGLLTGQGVQQKGLSSTLRFVLGLIIGSSALSVLVYLLFRYGSNR